MNSVISDVSFDTKKQLVAATFLDDGDTNASARCLVSYTVRWTARVGQSEELSFTQFYI